MLPASARLRNGSPDLKLAGLTGELAELPAPELSTELTELMRASPTHS